MYRLTQRFIHATLFCWFLSALPVSIPAALAQQQDCAEQLAQAEQQYDIGRFDAVIEALQRCEQEYTGEQRRQAYRLLSLCYLGKELADDAKDSIRKLLELVPNYQPDPIQDPPAFAEMVAAVKAQIEAEQPPVEQEQPPPPLVPPIVVDEEPPPTPVVVPPRRKSNVTKWLLIGGGVVAGGVVAVVLLSGGGDTLPGPPDLPGVN